MGILGFMSFVRHEGDSKDGAPRKEAELILPLTGFEPGTRDPESSSKPTELSCLFRLYSHLKLTIPQHVHLQYEILFEFELAYPL